MNIIGSSVGRVFVQAIRSGLSEFSSRVGKLMCCLASVRNSNENMNRTKEWKREVAAAFPFGIRASDIQHPHTYKNSSSDIPVTKPDKLRNLAREIRLFPGYIKLITPENTPASYKQFNNRDAF